MDKVWWSSAQRQDKLVTSVHPCAARDLGSPGPATRFQGTHVSPTCSAAVASPEKLQRVTQAPVQDTGAITSSSASISSETPTVSSGPGVGQRLCPPRWGVLGVVAARLLCEGPAQEGHVEAGMTLATFPSLSADGGSSGEDDGEGAERPQDHRREEG